MTDERFKVLIIPSWYMNPQYPHAGIFFKQQAQLLNAYCDVCVAVVSLFRFRDALGYFRNGSFRNVRDESGLRHFYLAVWNMLPFRKMPLVHAAETVVRRLSCFFKKSGWQPDVIHVHSVYPGGVYALSLHKRLRIPLVVTEHRTYIGDFIRDNPALRDILFEIYRAASEVIVVSEGLKKRLRNAGINRRLTIIPNTVDVDFYIPDGNDTPREKGYRLLFVGHLTRRKGVDILLKSLYEIVYGKGIDRIRLEVVGDGPEKDNLHRECDELKLNDFCTFAGSMEKPALRDAMRGCDVFVLPSRAENFGVVVIEAMACGKPVVVTKCGGPEYIVTPSTGVVVAPEDVNALSSGIISILENYMNYDAGEIRNETVSLYSGDKICKDLVNLYRQIIEKTRRQE